MDRIPCSLLVGCYAAAGMACSQPVEPGLAGKRAAIIYDGDQRQELFELESEPIRVRVERSVVAFLPRSTLLEREADIDVLAPSRSELHGVCSDERFADQPAAAVCSGVLVDWDLVLTAGHCVRAFRLDELAVAFGYYYRATAQLALARGDLYEPVEVVSDAIELQAGRATLDYAFVRLAHAAGPPRAPAAIRGSASAAALGATLISAGASEGVPIKVDRGGTIRATRPSEWDHFVADTDTAEGGSGGGAFDAELALLGVLFRGGDDLVEESGCYRTHRASGGDAEEAFSYAGRALAELCARHPDASSLCRADCGDPCSALAPATDAEGCSLARLRTRADEPAPFALTLALAALALTRRRLLTPRRCP
jgi:hypothetical protein